MLTRVLISVLLVATQLPAVLAGQLVYHCRVTGSSSLSCALCAHDDDSSCVVETPACCFSSAVKRGSAQPSGESNLDTLNGCGCCDVTPLRWVGQRPRVSSFDHEHELAAETMAVETVRYADPTRRIVASADSHSPPPRAPIFILHASLVV